MEMPFVKHEGEEVDDLPTPYLVWCLHNLEDLDQGLEMEMEDELGNRLIKTANSSGNSKEVRKYGR